MSFNVSNTRYGRKLSESLAEKVKQHTTVQERADLEEQKKIVTDAKLVKTPAPVIVQRDEIICAKILCVEAARYELSRTTDPNRASRLKLSWSSFLREISAVKVPAKDIIDRLSAMKIWDTKASSRSSTRSFELVPRRITSSELGLLDFQPSGSSDPTPQSSHYSLELLRGISSLQRPRVIRVTGSSRNDYAKLLGSM